jgi:hypothetical protein
MPQELDIRLRERDNRPIKKVVVNRKPYQDFGPISGVATIQQAQGVVTIHA